jgi:hypothetical protein
MSFNVKQHLIKVSGGKDYLPVAYRLVWFREEHPDWGIATAPAVIDAEKGYAIFHAEVTNAEGRLVAAGTKMETARNFGDFVEKAETGSIGRALGVLGFGTQFAPEFDEGIDRIVDSPMPVGNGNRKPEPPPTPAKPSVANIGRDFSVCDDCGRPLTNPERDFSTSRFGKPLCRQHQPRTVGR